MPYIKYYRRKFAPCVELFLMDKQNVQQDFVLY